MSEDINLIEINARKFIMILSYFIYSYHPIYYKIQFIILYSNGRALLIYHLFLQFL